MWWRMVGQGIAGSDQKISCSSHTRIELQAAAAWGLGCCWACGVSGVAVRSGFAPFYPQYFLGVLNSSSTYSTFWVLEIDVPTTDLLLRKYTEHTKRLHRMICTISRRALHFDLQARDRQEARRGTCGVGCDLL